MLEPRVFIYLFLGGGVLGGICAAITMLALLNFTWPKLIVSFVISALFCALAGSAVVDFVRAHRENRLTQIKCFEKNPGALVNIPEYLALQPGVLYRVLGIDGHQVRLRGANDAPDFAVPDTVLLFVTPKPCP
jgi:hypothetical protein